MNRYYTQFLKGPYSHCVKCEMYVTQTERDSVALDRAFIDHQYDLIDCARYDAVLALGERIDPKYTLCHRCHMTAIGAANIRTRPITIHFLPFHFFYDDEEGNQ